MRHICGKKIGQKLDTERAEFLVAVDKAANERAAKICKRTYTLIVTTFNQDFAKLFGLQKNKAGGMHLFPNITNGLQN